MAKGFVVLSFVLAIALGQDFEIGTRILGGADAPRGQYPYQISIRYSGSHICGGSIIDNEWILTAAHCVKPFTVPPLTVYAGSNKKTSGGSSYKVLQIFYHENYDARKKNDVAVLKVEPITYTDVIQPIALDADEIGGNVTCILSGWGLLSHPGESAEDLQYIELKTTTAEFCKRQHDGNIIEGELCTFTTTGEGPCKGDSGGPLVRKVDGAFKQIGVVSWGTPCARGLPDVYTRVSAYIPWIQAKCNCI